MSVPWVSHGLGDMLCSEVVRFAREKGAARACASCATGNATACGVHTSKRVLLYRDTSSPVVSSTAQGKAHTRHTHT